MPDADRTEELQQTVLQAVREDTPLQIVAAGSKSFYGRQPHGRIFKVNGHQGVINYQPSELVITARAGTPLVEIQQLLAGQRQMLAFEPPDFAGSATLGGTMACGFSGPRRAFAGAARDHMLGCKLLNGRGQVLTFGGEVMKNVAGYDVSRLLVGALGTLGILLQVSLKVLPLPERESTRCFAMPLERAVRKMADWQSQSLPLSALAYDQGRLYVRLSGADGAVAAAGSRLGGDAPGEEQLFWEKLREKKLRFFDRQVALWRISVAPHTPQLAIEGEWLYDWGGALRWLKTDAPAQEVFAAAARVQGHALQFWGKQRSGQIFQPLPKKLQELHGNLKRAFYPQGIFNPGRMYQQC